MRRRFIHLAAALAVLALVVTAAFALPRMAQHGFRDHGGPGGPPLGMLVEHMAGELNLGDEQKSQIEQIVSEEQTADTASHEQLRAIMDQLRTLGTDGQFDEAKVRELATQQAQLMTEQIVSHERTKAKIFAVLTPDQRTTLAARLQNPGPPPGAGFGPHKH